jgi:hypothetical protein
MSAIRSAIEASTELMANVTGGQSTAEGTSTQGEDGAGSGNAKAPPRRGMKRGESISTID